MFCLFSVNVSKRPSDQLKIAWTTKETVYIFRGVGRRAIQEHRKDSEALTSGDQEAADTCSTQTSM
jgi:hypothetical protein